MSTPHFTLQRRGNLRGPERGALFGQHDLEGQVQQQVAELVLQLGVILADDRIDRFVGLLQKVLRESSRGLGRIPRTVGAKKADQRESAVERARGVGGGGVEIWLRGLLSLPILRAL